MNIAFFSKNLPSDQPNGVSVQVDRLAEALAARGHRVTCFSFSPSPEGASYLTIQLPAAVSSKALNKFEPALAFKHIDMCGFDILYFHGDDYLCRGSRKRIRTFYGSARDEALHAKTPGRFCYQTLFHAFEWISCLRQGTLVGISEATKQALPLIRHIIPCGVPLDRFYPGPALKTPHPSLLFIGDFKSRKQGDFLLGIFNQTILPAHPAAVLTVVGPQTVSLPNVRCLGRITEQELVDEYRKSWIYCLPSSYEGFGVPAIEAMACGCAVAARTSPGIREVIDHDINGLLSTPQTFGHTLNLLLRNYDLRLRLVKAGLERIKKFNSSEIARSYERLYQNSAGAVTAD